MLPYLWLQRRRRLQAEPAIEKERPACAKAGGDQHVVDLITRGRRNRNLQMLFARTLTFMAVRQRAL